MTGANPEETPDRSASDGPLISRRAVLRGMGAGAALLGSSWALEACSGLKSNSGSSGKKITIGFVTPLTGQLAGFSVGDNYIVDTVRKSSAFSKGIKVGGKNYSVDIIVKDSQSDPNRASQVAKDLITTNKVDMIVVTSTPEVTNPVASVCEAQGVPCVATVVPWEAWYFGRGAKAGTTFNYTTMFFFGLKEFGETFIPMWDRIPNDKKVAEMFPNDADGSAFRNGWPALLKPKGYTGVDGGAFADGTTDYTAMISKFKSEQCDIYVNGPLPPDFNVFWKQAAQQGYKPKLATVAKVLLFPADVAALGDLVINIATDAWWAPTMPYVSSIDGTTAQQLADNFSTATGKQWMQSLGSTYSLFEVAQNAFKAASDPHDHKDVADKLRTMNYTGMCGPLNFGGGPVPGVGIMKPVGVQWKKGTGKFPYDLAIVDNSANPGVKVNGDLLPTNA